MRCIACNNVMTTKELSKDDEMCSLCRRTIYVDHDIPDSEIRLIDDEDRQ